MDKAKGLIIALVMFFILPAILTMTGFFQDYVNTNVGSSLGKLTQFVTDSWLFIVIGLFVIGIFLKIRKKDE
jgi:Fe2+ transport system protein B